MQIYWYPSDTVPSRERTITIGNFDGVHKGHQYILTQLVALSATETGAATVVTFTPHPREIVNSKLYPVLTPLEEQYSLFQQIGVTEVWVVPFTYEIQTLSPWEFYTDVIFSMKKPSRLILGNDHTFGYKGRGSIETARSIGDRYGISVSIAEQYSEREEVVKTTYIKTLLDQGNVETAARYLGRRYTLQGWVKPGKGFGTRLGFPTANIHVPQRKYIPKQGVYVVRVNVPERHVWSYGVLNIGFNPIVEERTTLSVEVYILHMRQDTDLYHMWMYMELLTYIREERSGGTLQDLQEWIQEDIDRANVYLTENEFE